MIKILILKKRRFAKYYRKDKYAAIRLSKSRRSKRTYACRAGGGVACAEFVRNSKKSMYFQWKPGIIEMAFF